MLDLIKQLRGAVVVVVEVGDQGHHLGVRGAGNFDVVLKDEHHHERVGKQDEGYQGGELIN